MTDTADTAGMRPRDTDEYPHAIQRAGPVAMRVFDQVEDGLLEDGYTQEVAEGLMMINLDQILAEAKTIAEQEATADKRRAANEKKQRQGRQGRHGNSHSDHNQRHS